MARAVWCLICCVCGVQREQCCCCISAVLVLMLLLCARDVLGLLAIEAQVYIRCPVQNNLFSTTMELFYSDAY